MKIKDVDTLVDLKVPTKDDLSGLSLPADVSHQLPALYRAASIPQLARDPEYQESMVKLDRMIKIQLSLKLDRRAALRMAYNAIRIISMTSRISRMVSKVVPNGGEIGKAALVGRRVTDKITFRAISDAAKVFDRIMNSKNVQDPIEYTKTYSLGDDAFMTVMVSEDLAEVTAFRLKNGEIERADYSIDNVDWDELESFDPGDMPEDPKELADWFAELVSEHPDWLDFDKTNIDSVDDYISSISQYSDIMTSEKMEKLAKKLYGKSSNGMTMERKNVNLDAIAKHLDQGSVKRDSVDRMELSGSSLRNASLTNMKQGSLYQFNVGENQGWDNNMFIFDVSDPNLMAKIIRYAIMDSDGQKDFMAYANKMIGSGNSYIFSSTFGKNTPKWARNSNYDWRKGKASSVGHALEPSNYYPHDPYSKDNMWHYFHVQTRNGDMVVSYADLTTMKEKVFFITLPGTEQRIKLDLENGVDVTSLIKFVVSFIKANPSSDPKQLGRALVGQIKSIGYNARNSDYSDSTVVVGK